VYKLIVDLLVVHGTNGSTNSEVILTFPDDLWEGACCLPWTIPRSCKVAPRDNTIKLSCNDATPRPSSQDAAYDDADDDA